MCDHWSRRVSSVRIHASEVTVSVTDQPVEYEFPPTFESVEDERRHRKERLAAALRVFGKFGFGEGVAGHITARDPELTDHFWVNPFGLSFRRVKVSDLLLVGPDGTVVEGSRPVNRAAFVIHAALHEARPDIVAAAHAHSVHGKAWSSLGRPLDPITQDACVFFEDHVVVADEGGRVVFEKEAGQALAEGLGTHKAAIHQNHGHFTVGQTVDEAAWWYIAMERSAQAQLLAEAAGTPHLIDPEGARYTRDLTGFPLAGWISYQPIWQDIVASDPDLFD